MKCNMIYLGFDISWPFKESKQKDYFYKCWKVTKNKSLEIQFSRMGNSLIGATFRYSIKEDHAGFLFDISLFHRMLNVTFSDNRHWNYDAGRYVNYDNPEEVEKYW